MQLMAAKRAQEAAQKADAAGLFLFWFDRWTLQQAGAALPRDRTIPQGRLDVPIGAHQAPRARRDQAESEGSECSIGGVERSSQEWA
jgi:hypothetical protein